MKLTDKQYDALVTLFRRADHETETIRIHPQWQQGVLRQIHALAQERSDSFHGIGFDQFVWRLSPVVCLLIVICAVVWYQMDIFPDYSAFQVMMNEDEALSIIQLAGLEL